MKANPGESQFMVLGVVNIAPLYSNVTGKIISCSSEVKLLGITIDNQLRFNLLSANPTKWSNKLKEFVGFCL